MANKNSSEEIDLGVLFNGIKSFFKRILILLYRFIQFCLRSWKIILTLLILGMIGGYFWQENSQIKKETVLIVRTNFESTSYVYSAIDQLNQNDLQEGGIAGISEIEIEPVINVEELFEDFDNEMVVIELLGIFQDEEGVYSPTAFVPRYTFHKIDVVFEQTSTEGNITELLNYLNNNPLLQEIKEVGLENLEQRLVDNQNMVMQINELLRSLSSSQDVNANSLMILQGNAGLPLDRILEIKKELLVENDEIRENIIAQQELVVLINKPRLLDYGNIFTKKMVLLPLLLIFIFLLFSFFIFLYRKMKKLSQENKTVY